MTRGGYFGSIMQRREHDALWLRTPQDGANLIEECAAIGWRRVFNVPGVLVVFASPKLTRFLHVRYHTRAIEAWWTYPATERA